MIRVNASQKTKMHPSEREEVEYIYMEALALRSDAEGKLTAILTGRPNPDLERRARKQLEQCKLVFQQAKDMLKN